MDPVIRRKVGNLFLLAVVSSDWSDTEAGELAAELTEGLGLTAYQQVAVADRLVGMGSLARLLIRAMAMGQPRLEAELPRLIDRATDRLAMLDTGGS